jgi:uncharacterized protein YjbJ (UPF0337 family)
MTEAEAKFELVKGRAKEVAGDLKDDDDLQTDGQIDQASGSVKERLEQATGKAEDVVERAKDKVEDAIDHAKHQAQGH